MYTIINRLRNAVQASLSKVERGVESCAHQETNGVNSFGQEQSLGTWHMQ